jgi:glycerophosphoryl diester phosphodiesterase
MKTVKKYDVGLKPHPRFPKQEKMKCHKTIMLSDVFDSCEKLHDDWPADHYPYFNIETKCLPETDGTSIILHRQNSWNCL